MRGALLVDVEPAAGPDRLAVLRTVRAAFGEPQDIAGSLAGHLLVLYRVRAERVGDAEPDLPERCAALVADIAERHGLTARVGVGAVATSVAGLRDSYEDAATALRLGALVAEGPVQSIEDVRLHQLLTAVGHRARARFADALTRELRSQPDWPVLRQTTVAWCESGFNLVRAAAALHIHRNTLIYRLEKISRLAGRDTREPRACLALYLACLADQI